MRPTADWILPSVSRRGFLVKRPIAALALPLTCRTAPFERFLALGFINVFLWLKARSWRLSLLWGKTINRNRCVSLTNDVNNGMLLAGTTGVVWAEAPGGSIRNKDRASVERIYGSTVKLQFGSA